MKNILKLFTLFGIYLVSTMQSYGAVSLPTLNVGFKSATTTQEFSQGVQILILLTILTLAPSILIMTTALILAYVGGSLTLILLFMACDFNFVQILNKETIAQEIISAIAGSMGVVYTVPITAFVYSFLNKNKVIYKTESENKVEGKRSLKL